MDFGKKKRKSTLKSEHLVSKIDGDVTKNDLGNDMYMPGELYSYEQLLIRVPFHESVKVVVLPIPELINVSGKTLLSNFPIYTKIFRRTPASLQTHITKELGTTASIRADKVLMIKGRFKEPHVETVLKSFVKELVRCAECKMIDTSLLKGSRITKLHCHSCGAIRTVNV